MVMTGAGSFGLAGGNAAWLRSRFFLTAVLVYAGFSQPTPDRLAWPEILTFLGILALTGLMRPFRAVTAQPLATEGGAAYEKWVSPALAYLVWVPGWIGLMRGHPETDVLRDLIAVLILFLPFLAAPCVLRNIAPATLAGVLAAAGGILALRHLGWIGEAGALAYLSGSPLLLYAALAGFGWALGSGLPQLSRGRAGFLTGTGLAFLGVVLLCVVLAAFAFSLQRAALLAAVGGLFMLVVAVWREQGPARPTILVCLALPAAVLASGAWESLQALWAVLSLKTALVGVNLRGAETVAALAWGQDNLWTLLFGEGWGASFPAPSVGPHWVSYTHVIWSAFVLKTGWIGTAVLAGLAGIYVGRLYRLIHSHSHQAIALGWPLALGVSVYTSYKSLGFGLLLLLLMQYTSPCRKRPHNGPAEKGNARPKCPALSS